MPGIPVFTVQTMSLPYAWEEALELTSFGGKKLLHEDTGDPYYQTQMVIRIGNPFSIFRYHKLMMNYCLPIDLLGYIEEVVKGTKDHFIDPTNPTAWHYTYHKRLTDYQQGSKHLDQLHNVVWKLASSPSSRRAQAITWVPLVDYDDTNPPCLQRLWFQIDDDYLNMHSHWRSRDAFLASYMNMIALTELQKSIATDLQVKVGYYLDISDSYHIYERDRDKVNTMVKLVNQLRHEEKWMTQEKFSELIEIEKELKTK